MTTTLPLSLCVSPRSSGISVPLRETQILPIRSVSTPMIPGKSLAIRVIVSFTGVTSGFSQLQGRRHKSRIKDEIEKGRKKEEFLRSEEHTSELQSRGHLVCSLLLEKNTV